MTVSASSIRITGAALTTLMLATAAKSVDAPFISIPAATGKTPTQVAQLLKGFRAERLRSDLLGGRPGSEWRFIDKKRHVIEVTFEGLRADKFLIMWAGFDKYVPSKHYKEVLGLVGFKAVKKPDRTHGPTQMWDKYKGYFQISIAGNGQKVTWVHVEKSERR